MIGETESRRAEAAACVAQLHGEHLVLAVRLLRDLRDLQDTAEHAMVAWDRVRLAGREVREREAAIQKAAGIITQTETFDIPAPCDSEVMPVRYATPLNDEPTSPETPRAKYLGRDVTGRRT